MQWSLGLDSMGPVIFQRDWRVTHTRLCHRKMITQLSLMGRQAGKVRIDPVCLTIDDYKVIK
jgi:hypothetical protein